MAEFGVESCFSTAAAEETVVALLDSTHCVVAYGDSSTHYGYARVGLINGNAITWGAINAFNSAATTEIAIAALDSTHFVVTYKDSGDSSHGTARIGLVSGTTISSYGTENEFNSTSTDGTSVTSLDSTHFVVGYERYSSGAIFYGYTRVGSVSGTTITYGAESLANSGATGYVSIGTLDSTHFVIAYKDIGGSSYCVAKIGLVSGTTVSSYGTASTANSADTDYISVTGLDSTHFAVSYRDSGGTGYGYAKVGLVSSTTISSYGAENAFNSASTYHISIAALDSTHFVVVYRDDGNSLYGTSIVGVISGITIASYGSENVFNSVTTTYTDVAMISPTDYIVVYRDHAGGGYGCARVWGTVSGWSGIIIGVSSPAKVMGIDGANITSVIGIS